MNARPAARPRWRTALRGVAVLLGLALIWVGAPPADAVVVSGPPGPAGEYGVCQINVSHHANRIDNFSDLWVTCNVATTATYIGGTFGLNVTKADSSTVQINASASSNSAWSGKTGVWKFLISDQVVTAGINPQSWRITRLPMTGAGPATVAGVTYQREEYPEPPQDLFTGGWGPTTLSGRVDVEAAFNTAWAAFVAEPASWTGVKDFGSVVTAANGSTWVGTIADYDSGSKLGQIGVRYTGATTPRPSPAGICMDWTWNRQVFTLQQDIPALDRYVGGIKDAALPAPAAAAAPLYYYPKVAHTRSPSGEAQVGNSIKTGIGSIYNAAGPSIPDLTPNSIWSSSLGDEAGCRNEVDPGVMPPPVTVGGPNLQCWREFEQRPDGNWYANVHARVTNPQQYATDTVSIRLPWETSDRGVADTGSFVVPLDGMTAGGWRAQCKVHRSLDLTAANGLSPYALVGSGDMKQAGWIRIDDADPDEALVGPVGPAGISTEWMTAYVGTGAAGAAVAAAQSGVAVTAGVVAGAALVGAGALYLGNKTGIVSLDPDGCSLYDRLRDLVTDWSCPPKEETQPEEDVYLRQQVQFANPDGDVMTQTELETATETWGSATAIAEVLLSPAKPAAGTETVVATDISTTTLTETDIETIKEDPIPEADPEVEASECPAGVTIILPWNFLKLFKCMFIPRESVLRSKVGTITDKVPFVVIDEVVTGLGAVYEGLEFGLDSNCFTVEASKALPDDEEAGFGSLDVTLPAPTSAGCDGSNLIADPTNDAGELWGWRETIRTAMLVLLLLAVCFKVVAAFKPNGDPDEVRPL